GARLVVNRHQPEGIGAVTRPVMIWTQANASVRVFLLVIPAERIAPSFSSRCVEADGWKDAPHSLNARICSASPHVRDHLHIEAGLAQCALIADGVDLVVSRP